MSTRPSLPKAKQLSTIVINHLYYLEPDPTIAITSKCTKLLEVCCRHPSFTLPPSCENEPDYDDVDEKVFNDDPFDTDDEDDDIFDTDDEDGDIFGTDDEEDDIFTEPNSPGQCGKRNSEGVSNAIGEVALISKS